MERDALIKQIQSCLSAIPALRDLQEMYEGEGEAEKAISEAAKKCEERLIYEVKGLAGEL